MWVCMCVYLSAVVNEMSEARIDVVVERPGIRQGMWTECTTPSVWIGHTRATATLDGETFGPMTLAEARAMQDEAFENFRLRSKDSEDWDARYRIASAIIDKLTGVER